VGWVFILVRVYPFWAIPLAFTLIMVSLRSKNIPKARRSGLLVVGVLLIASSIAFLFLQGHNTAVPWIHEVFSTPLLRR
jgi:hypothetical protein